MDGDVCPMCGLKYKDFRCSLKAFSEVKEQMFIPSEQDPTKWKYKRKKGVLGYWHMVKKTEWQHHLDDCCDACYDTQQDEVVRVY